MIITLEYMVSIVGSVELLYELLRERTTEDAAHVNISHHKMPSVEEHETFVLENPYRLWLAVMVDGKFAGSLTVTFRNEVGIILHRGYRGKGIGRRAMEMLLQRHRPLPAIPAYRTARYVANINPANAASIALFTGLGAKHISNTYELPERGEQP